MLCRLKYGGERAICANTRLVTDKYALKHANLGVYEHIYFPQMVMEGHILSRSQAYRIFIHIGKIKVGRPVLKVTYT